MIKHEVILAISVAIGSCGLKFLTIIAEIKNLITDPKPPPIKTNKRDQLVNGGRF